MRRFALLVRCALVAALSIAAACEKEKTETVPENAPGQVAITTPVGFVWKWEGTQTPVERIVPDDPSKYTIEFLPDTSVAVRVDCNRGGGPCRMDGKSIAIGPLALTRMACPAGSFDTKFAQQLAAARTVFFRGDTLYMDLFADSGTMRFSQMPEPPQQ